jgi:hypothetical protein
LEEAAIEIQKPGIAGVELHGDFTVDAFYEKFPIDCKFPFHKELVSGKILIYEAPSKLHEIVATEIAFQFRDLFGKVVVGSGSADIRIKERTIREPDQSLYVDPEEFEIQRAVDAANEMLPRIVIEVSYSEGYQSIFGLPAQYFSVGDGNGIRGVVLIIIRRHDIIHDRFQMIACYYRYNLNVPTRILSFGHYLDPRTEASIILYSGLTNITANGIFRGVGRMNPDGGLDPLCEDDSNSLYHFPIESDDLWYGCNAATRQLYNVGEYIHINLFQMKNMVVRSKR